jgi:hypothetical protein
MRFVVPVSQSDRHLLSKRIEVFKHLGGWKNHHLLFAPAPSCLPEAEKAAEEMRPYCPNVEVRAVVREPSGGWPEACNKHFHDTVNLLGKLSNPLNWFFLELDCNPIRQGWQDALETAYNSGGKPFCGHVRPTSEVTNPPLKGSHMVGAGMYPFNFHVIAAAEYPYLAPKVPFDVTLRWRVLQSGVTHTDLIAHRHSTKEYTLEGTVLIPNEGTPVDINGTALVHGCKDDTLADLVLSGALDFFPPLIKAAPAPVKAEVTTKAHVPSLESQLSSAGYRSIMKGVWAHSTVSNESIANHLGVKTEVQASKPPLTEMDYAIMRERRKLESQPVVVPQVSQEESVATDLPQPISDSQHGIQGEPESGLVTPHETLISEDTSPEPGADNAAPPIHTVTEDTGHQGERCDASSVAASGSESQTGQSFIDDLTLKVARSKPKRIRDWAEELQVTHEELRSLINSHPESRLKIATAGWLSIASA